MSVTPPQIASATSFIEKLLEPSTVRWLAVDAFEHGIAASLLMAFAQQFDPTLEALRIADGAWRPGVGLKPGSARWEAERSPSAPQLKRFRKRGWSIPVSRHQYGLSPEVCRVFESWVARAPDREASKLALLARRIFGSGAPPQLQPSADPRTQLRYITGVVGRLRPLYGGSVRRCLIVGALTITAYTDLQEARAPEHVLSRALAGEADVYLSSLTGTSARELSEQTEMSVRSARDEVSELLDLGWVRPVGRKVALDIEQWWRRAEEAEELRCWLARLSDADLRPSPAASSRATAG
jgi:hypothetical protein